MLVHLHCVDLLVMDKQTVERVHSQSGIYERYTLSSNIFHCEPKV